ncbi:symmetrical bis(5'-nucleosyl)-tetraphosphatase [Legionella nagasakiensis]|uniref:symmetrical bis(5'-nucleosyl)-tetraphosphatase n=1 Tax=Legionella nagasakiensis TaxID=535290 RepID=UPI0010568A77|nr:symmetrical bis(5'-nucleosyl)-tetraphosphatase [Legionella nagasakiensis]
MADYVIGDVQGCYDPLQRLLERVDFDERKDRLWFVGDLVNRGPQSLAVLRFIKQLPQKSRITLGNHDLHLLNRLFCKNTQVNSDDTLREIIEAPERDELGHWLRKQDILIYDKALNIVMCHAGIAPMWTLSQAMQLAEEVEYALRGDYYEEFLSHMYGNEPDLWSANLSGTTRLRVICNYFTRMRFCDEQGRLCFNYKGTVSNAPKNLYPWYAVPQRHEISADIVFGHWAALLGQCPHPRIYAIDTGCLWGGQLTALRLQDRQCFAVPGLVGNE